MHGSGASKEEIEEVEAAIAAVRERLGEPVRVGEENEVLKVVTEEDFLVLGGDWFASSIRARPCSNRAPLRSHRGVCKLRERILDSIRTRCLKMHCGA